VARLRSREKALAYCIDLHHPVALNRDYAEGSWSESEVRDLAKVQWVLLHGHPTVAARPTYRTLFEHPSEDRFTADEFVAACETVGLHVGDRYFSRIGGDYLVGAARRA
jgi:hypothetical protein